MKSSELVDQYFEAHQAIVSRFNIGEYYLDNLYQEHYWVYLKGKHHDKLLAFEEMPTAESDWDWFHACGIKEKGDMALVMSDTGAYTGDEYCWYTLEMGKKITDKEVVEALKKRTKHL